jgi:hypothetical protein
VKLGLEELRAKVAAVAAQREQLNAAYEDERAAVIDLLEVIGPLIKRSARGEHGKRIVALLRRLADDIEGKL